MKIAAIIDIRCKPERSFGFDRIAMRIARFPEVLDVMVISGRSDLTVKIEGKNLDEISKFVTEKLSPMENVESTSTQFFLKIYKSKGKILIKEPKSSRIPVAP